MVKAAIISILNDFIVLFFEVYKRKVGHTEMPIARHIHARQKENSQS
jgi:hypothetical protein